MATSMQDTNWPENHQIAGFEAQNSRFVSIDEKIHILHVVGSVNLTSQGSEPGPLFLNVATSACQSY